MRGGFKVWDTDTHVQPSIDSLEPYFDPAFRAKMPELKRYEAPSRSNMETTPREYPGRRHYSHGQVRFRRVLGQAEPPTEAVPNRGKFMGTKLPAVSVIDDAWDDRIKDMDEEGVDVQLFVAGVPMGMSLLGDPTIEMGLITGHNRYMNDVCCRYPGRFKAMLVVSGNAVEESVAEIKQWGGTRWCVGVWPFPGGDRPLDHPDMEPIWQAVDDHGLSVIHHSLAWSPPYFPGYRDLWDNLFLGRAAAHPWGAMRAVGSFIGAGIMDRYPNLRFGILESGCGWLPFWARHLDDQAEYVGAIAPLKHKISEYMTGGRFFSSIEMHEGEDMIKMVMDFLGDDILMYASDYPHPECLFPHSVDHFLEWTALTTEQKRRLLWDNPVRFYGEP